MERISAGPIGDSVQIPQSCLPGGDGDGGGGVGTPGMANVGNRSEKRQSKS